MINTELQPNKAHHGRNIKRLREMLGIKQEVIAIELGITQQAVSALENKEQIEEGTIQKIAQALKVPAEAIKNMTDEATVNFINTFNDNAVNHGHGTNTNYNCTFNPLDKVVELYERMLKSEKEKNEFLKKLLDK